MYQARDPLCICNYAPQVSTFLRLVQNGYGYTAKAQPFSYNQMDMQSSSYLLTCVFLIEGISTGVKKENLCYGRKLVLPSSFNPLLYKGPIYFTPKGESTSSRRIIMNDGQVTPDSI